MPTFEIVHTVIQRVTADTGDDAELIARRALDSADLHSAVVLEDADIEPAI